MAYTDRLAAGHEKLRKALAEIVRKAMEDNKVNKNTAERWLEKLEEGRVLMEGWPKYSVVLAKGALMVRFSSTNPDSIKQEVQRLEEMGLTRGDHFTVKMPDGGKLGYVDILTEGLAYAAWLSVNSEGKQQELVANFVELILQRAKEACRGAEQCPVYEKAKEIIDWGRSRSSQELERFEKKAEVNGKTYFVKVTGWGAEIEESQNGKALLRIKIKAEVGRVQGAVIEDRVVYEYTITYSRRGAINAAVGYAVVREADAERLIAVIMALTGREPGVYRRSGGKIEVKCYRGHLEGFMRYKELAGPIKNWLEETSR
jgi:Fe2+ transport system protein FeoA